MGDSPVIAGGCPYCGEQEKLKLYWGPDSPSIPVYGGTWYVQCESCWARSSREKTREAAARQWDHVSALVCVVRRVGGRCTCRGTVNPDVLCLPCAARAAFAKIEEGG
jgi:hypothetical protein